MPADAEVAQDRTAQGGKSASLNLCCGAHRVTVQGLGLGVCR